MEKKLPRIERGITKIIVPHEKGETVFDGHSQEPDHYQSVGGGLLARNLEVPTAEQTAYLVHAAYCISETENEPEFKEIRNSIMSGRWFWVFNRNIWTSEGVYVVPDLNAVGRSQTLNQDKLEKMLKGGKELSWGGIRLSKDRKVRFAPKDSYELEDHTPESLAKDGFVIASYNPVGAEKFGEVSSKFKYNPKTYGLNIQKGQNPEQRVSTLSDYGGVLSIDGHDFGGDGKGCAFGVLK